MAEAYDDIYQPKVEEERDASRMTGALPDPNRTLEAPKTPAPLHHPMSELDSDVMLKASNGIIEQPHGGRLGNSKAAHQMDRTTPDTHANDPNNRNLGNRLPAEKVAGRRRSGRGGNGPTRKDQPPGQPPPRPTCPCSCGCSKCTCPGDNNGTERHPSTCPGDSNGTERQPSTCPGDNDCTDRQPSPSPEREQRPGSEGRGDTSMTWSEVAADDRYRARMAGIGELDDQLRQDLGRPRQWCAERGLPYNNMWSLRWDDRYVYTNARLMEYQELMEEQAFKDGMERGRIMEMDMSRENERRLERDRKQRGRGANPWKPSQQKHRRAPAHVRCGTGFQKGRRGDMRGNFNFDDYQNQHRRGDYQLNRPAAPLRRGATKFKNP